VLAASSGPLALDASADAVSGEELLRLHNSLRAAAGAPTVPGDSRVALAAQRHANYSSANNSGGHYETAGYPHYSGYAPRDRVAAAGWSTSFVSEVAASYTGAARALQELWHAPYHRLGMMHPSVIAAGWGHSDLSGRASTVGDFVYDFGYRPIELVRSPGAGQTGIPTSWSGNESPSPLPAGVRGPVGYPIMVVYSGAPAVDMRSAELLTPSGSQLPIYYVPQIWERDYQAIIPQQPLAEGTTYRVRFHLTVSGTPVTLEWTFTTAGVDSGFHGGWVDQSASGVTVAPGASAPVTVRFRNTGTRTWQKGVYGSEARLGIPGDDPRYANLGMADGWPSANRVALQQEQSVAPGQIATFAFNVRGPVQPGSYRLPLRAVIDGVTWLEDYGVFVDVVSRRDFHSRWHSQSPHVTLAPGELSPVLFVKFTNTGSEPWRKGVADQEAHLGVQGDDSRWAPYAVDWLSSNRPAAQTEATVSQGQVGTFAFQLRAPTQPGVYVIRLQPVVDGVTWMEDDGVWVQVTVR
jgi:hypothetical protein